jgi:hypothetical protein
MKKYLIILSVLITPYILSAQENPIESYLFFDNYIKDVKKNNTIPYPIYLTEKNVPSKIEEYNWWPLMNNWEHTRTKQFIFENNKQIGLLSFDPDDTRNTFKTNYIYNSENKLIEINISSDKDSDYKIPYYRYLFTYSNNNREITLTTMIYDYLLEKWEYDYRINELIDDRGRTIRFIHDADIDGIWYNQVGIATEYTYLNANSNKIIQRIDSFLFANNTQMKANTKTIFLYNLNEENTDIVTYYYKVNGFEIYSHDKISYRNAIPFEIIRTVYDSIQNPLLQNKKFSNLTWANYNPNTDLIFNTLNSYTISVGNFTVFQNQFRISKDIIDNNGSSILTVEKYIDNAWQYKSRESVLFNNFKDNYENSIEQFDSVANKWMYTDLNRNNLTYDFQNNLVEKAESYFSVFDSTFVNKRKFVYSDFISTSTGISNTSKHANFKIYPNPSRNGTIYINFNMEKASEVTINILDLQGRTIQTTKNNRNMGMNTYEMSGLNKGAYILEFRSNNIITKEKIHIQ